jgi:hypothetical protein
MEIRSGDWLCPMCRDLNFASRQVCRKCNTVRPDLAATSQFGAPRIPYGDMQAAMMGHLGVVGAGAPGTNSSRVGGGGAGSGPGGEGGADEQALALQAMQQIQAFKAMQEQLQAAAMQHALAVQQQAAVAQMMGRAGVTTPLFPVPGRGWLVGWFGRC